MVVVKTKGVATEFEPLPANNYNVTLSKKEVVAQSRSSGKPAFKVELTVNTPADYAGKKLFINGSLQEHALMTFKRVLIAFGAEDEYIEADEVDADEALGSIVGRTADVRVTMGMYQNKPSNNVDVILEGDSNGENTGW